MMALISVNNIKRACLAAIARQENEEGSLAIELVQAFKAPEFYLDNNKLGFSSGVDKATGTPCFVMELGAARQLIKRLEARLQCDLSGALALVEAGLKNQPPKYDMLQQVNLANEMQYKGVVNSFPKLARQSKSQAMYEEVRTQLTAATELSSPLSKAAVQSMLDSSGRGRRQQDQVLPRVRMFVSLDFEWWEKSSETILEVGWSLWDTLTQRHRTRHWIIKENLNKHNGGYISDNRMNFLFGTSERGSLERAFDALQAELDALGVSDGLTRQQKDLLEGCEVDLVLVGHAMKQDQEHAELFEIEWPEGMVTFDTQKLFTAYQLEQLDAAAAAAALRDLLSRRKAPNDPSGVKPTTLELVDQYEEQAEESDPDDGYGVPDDDLDSDDSDLGLPGAVSNLALAKVKKGRPRSSGSGSDNGSRIAAVQPAKPKPVQGPVRVRPWPAGPLPSEREDKPDKTETKQKDKVNRQIGLGPMLAELKIKSQRLHNAGNDARFTMEAFLALTGHPLCSDPAAAHANALKNDPRYKQQLEASIQAAAEQGWGVPMPVQVPANRRGKTPPAGGSAGTSPLPLANGRGGTLPAGRSTPDGRPAAAAGGAWGRPAPAASASSNGSIGAWGKPAPAAAAAAGAAAAAPAAKPRGWQSSNPYLPNNVYQPTEDTW